MEVRMIRADPRKSVAREVQNKMRPRPATRAASLVSATSAGFTASSGEAWIRKPHSRRSVRSPAHPVDDPSANTRFADIVLRRLRERAASVLLFREGLSEEAATPEFPETRRSAFLKTLPEVHPREPPVTASSVTVANRLNASHVCTVSTLREYRIMRNGKLTLSCAEAVEDETSLWKGKENEAVNLTSAPTSKSPESYSGLSNSCWTMPVSIHDSFPIRAVKQYPQYSSDLGGRGIRTLVAGQPLECLTDIVQYPLATPSRRCLRKIIVWRQMFHRAITAKYVGMECRSGKKARPKPCLTAWIFSAPLCLCG